jgi:uronate dehydrogenase
MAMDKRRVLLTGAAGAVGRVIRQHLKGRFELLRLSDIAAMEPAGPNEETVICDLANADDVVRLCEGIDTIIHMGGRSTEAGWATINAANITGLINLYEGARKAGVRRVLFASSNHAVGFYKRSEEIDHTAAAKPDSRYGLSKAFGEDLARYYQLKHGIASLVIRIGSCFPKPQNRRMLSLWLSYPDCCRLIDVGLDADYAYEIVYGVSRNTRAWWDNSNAFRLGYVPEDNAEVFAAELEGVHSDIDIDEALQGGQFVSPDFTGRKDWVL